MVACRVTGGASGQAGRRRREGEVSALNVAPTGSRLRPGSFRVSLLAGTWLGGAQGRWTVRTHREMLRDVGSVGL